MSGNPRGLWAALLVASLIPFGGIGAAESLPESGQAVRLMTVKGVEQSDGASLQLGASGPFSFTSYQPDARSLVVDLAGVVSASSAVPEEAPVAWVASYRVLPFRNASGRPVLRLDLSLAQDCEVRLSQPSEAALLLSCPGATGFRPAAAESAPTNVSSEPVRVNRITVEKQDGRVTVNVQASSQLGYETLTLTEPTRLVVDLPQSILVSRQREVPVHQQAVAGVRVGQFKAEPPITRLVVDLREMVPYEINATETGLEVTLATSGNAVLTPVKPAPPQVAKVSATPPAPEREESDLPAATKPASQADPEEAPSKQEPTLVASLAPTIPSARVATEEPERPAQPVEVAQASLPATEATQQPMPGATAQQAPVPTSEQPVEYTGEPISVNLKDVDLKDFFRLIHEISGLNIVVDPNVSGTVTLVLIDVPWDQALDIVLRNNGLASTLEGNVLRIATRGTLKQEQQEEAELAQARAEAVAPVMVTRQLSYAQSGDLMPVLQRFLSSRGEIIEDRRTNTLIIRDIPSVIPAIDNIIQQLDRKSLQVEIEARVVSASRAFARSIGTQLAFSAATGSRRSVVGGALGPSPFQSLTPVPPPLVSTGGAAGAQPLVTSFPIAATSAILFGNRWENVALDVILQAAETRNIAKVLSRPRLITQNNIEARVQQGTRIPVQTVVNNTISTQFIDVVLELRVTPQITAEGTVFLNIHIENTTIDPGIARINGIPALATQSTDTQVLVTDGGTVVIGGVMVTNNSTTISQVPLLGSIPIIGHLFKSTEVQTSTSELLFFITPRILES